jgi:chitin disaccharide deacetylase
MLIVNADDWGRSPAETDAAYRCYAKGRIQAVTAMVFMEDSERAAGLAKTDGLDVGLHLNLNQAFAVEVKSPLAGAAHRQVVRFMARSKYAQLLYNPFLREALRCTYQAQAEEFSRLYGREPSHIDGHQHRHLCTNMLLDGLIPAGQRVRRSFSFWPGEKGAVNRAYRRWVDKRLARTYRLTDYFFSLGRCLQTASVERVFRLAGSAEVELMTHPVKALEYEYLMGEQHLHALSSVRTGRFQTQPSEQIESSATH